MTDLERQLNGYRLTTAEITYRMPDHLDLLQTYVWQALDLAPNFPELRKFLKFWAGSELLRPARSRYVDVSLALH